MDGFSDNAVCLHLPGNAEPYVRGVLAARSISIRISRPRRTKLGDHRPPRRGEPMHRISVNDDLNPYAFLTTLLHEVAHADVWERHPRRWRRPKPHGREWQDAFRELLAPVVAGGWLPQDVTSALESFMERPAAMSCTDRGLVLALARHDRQTTPRTRVEDLAAGQWFRCDDGRVFRLGRRVRTRYRCTERGTGAEYRVHALAFAEVVAPPATRVYRRGAAAR